MYGSKNMNAGREVANAQREDLVSMKRGRSPFVEHTMERINHMKWAKRARNACAVVVVGSVSYLIDQYWMYLNTGNNGSVSHYLVAVGVGVVSLAGFVGFAQRAIDIKQELKSSLRRQRQA